MGIKNERFSWLDDKKWPRWRVTVGVVLFCAFAWPAIITGMIILCQWLAGYAVEAINQIGPWTTL